MTDHAPQPRSQSRYLDGRKLRAARDAKGLSQPALAELVGARQADVSNWERCVNGCHRLMVDSLAAALDVRPADLMLDSALAA